MLIMLRIKKLDIFITKQFGLLFVGTFFICQFVLMMQFLWRYVDELIGKGLSLDIMAQFFWYMGLMLLPQALPLAILLSSLIVFGNLGESSELTAIKAAGISLMQAFRSLIVLVILIAGVSYYFQDKIGPQSNLHLHQLLISMKQKSPELEIPEGVFYDGIPGSNIYVQKKDLNTGMLYGIMIYRQTGSYEVANSANIPYRRETFSSKRIVLDFDGDFNLADMNDVAGDARAKSLSQILHDLDSLKEFNDSVGRAYYDDARRYTFRKISLPKNDSLKLAKELSTTTMTFDTLFERQSKSAKQTAMKSAISNVQAQLTDIQVRLDYTSWLHRNYRQHQIEVIGKFTLALSCIIFFFIGAPLGAIIRKGGLGMPVIISVLVFIVYYIFDNSGMRMARDGQWTILFGKLISTAVLTPIAVFFTYKANKDSTVFNIDLYKNVFMKLFGLRMKRHIPRKEVIIEDPHYAEDANILTDICNDISSYSENHKLLRWPNPIVVFFHEGDDQDIEHISERLETVIEDLSNTRDRLILGELNNLPILAVSAHTRPFRQKWLNIITGLLIPVGAFFYVRMIRFRLRLYRDLRNIRQSSENIIQQAQKLAEQQ